MLINNKSTMNSTFVLIMLASMMLFGCSSASRTDQLRTVRQPLQFVAEMGGCFFQFETNGNYSVWWEYYSMATKERRRIDAGTWRILRANRLKMVSNKLLFSPKLEYDSFAIEISTRESLDVWIQVADAILSLSSNAIFSVDDFREVCREKIAHLPYECVEEETRGGSVQVLKKVIPRRGFEKFRSDLLRLKQVPEWWTVSCDWVAEGGKIKLIPEKSKEEDFRLFYFSLFPSRCL